MQRMMPQDPQAVPKVQETTEDRNSDGASRTGANVRTRGTRSALSIAQGARREMIQSESLDPKHNQIPTN